MKLLTRNTQRLKVRPLDSKDYHAWKTAQLSMVPSKNIWDLGPKQKKEITSVHFKKLLRDQATKRKKDLFYSLGVFDRHGTLVGLVSIMEVARGISQTAFLGYRIFNNHWGIGYGKEAVAAILDIGFKDLKLHRIEAGVEPGNIRSIRLARALGMRREGLKKRAIFLRDKWVDLLMYTLTSEDVGLKFNTKSLKQKNRS